MESNDLMDELESVERVLNIYDIKSEDLVKEIKIDISVETLKSIVTPIEGDYLLYRGYMLNAKQLEALNLFLPDAIIPDFNSYYYVLECFGIYKS